MGVRLGLLLLVSAVAPTLHADDVAAPATQTTIVQGAPPALAGRWLAVANLTLQQRTRNTVAFWDVQRGGDGLVLTERFLEMPPGEQAAMARADAAGESWTPSAAAIAAVGERWDLLPVRDVGLQTVENEIIADEEFDRTLREEPATKDALWVVRQRYVFAPGSTTSRQETVWAGVAATRDGYRANVVSATVAAPFPIPLEFTGTGTLFRLDDAPPDTLLGRIAAMFRGCGRR